MNVLSASGQLGYGMYQESIDNALREYNIDFIAADSGSNDGGPGYYSLKNGALRRSEENLKKDLSIILKARDEIDVPFLTGSAGGAGTQNQVDRVVDIVSEIAEKEALDISLAKIYTDVDKDLLKLKIENDEVAKLSFDKTLIEKDVENSEEIVAQIGYKPFAKALESGADVIIAGRSLDTSAYAAIPLMNGLNKGLSIHLAKLLECGASVSRPKTPADSVVGVINDDYFEVIPANPKRKCTIESVAAQTLHEKSNPNKIWIPSGEVDISQSTYDQESERKVRVRGSEFKKTSPHTVLIEGIKKSGYRSLSIAGVQGPLVIENINSIIGNTDDRVNEMIDLDPNSFSINVRVYGTGEVSLFKDTNRTIKSDELGIIIDVVGKTQSIANEVCNTYKSALNHMDFKEKLNIGANIASPFSPGIFSAGETYEWSIYHLLEDIQPEQISETEMLYIKEGTVK